MNRRDTQEPTDRPGVLVVAGEFPPGPGGIGTHAHHLAVGLDARGWRVAVASPQDYVEPDVAAAFVDEAPYAFLRLERGGGPIPEYARWRRGLDDAARRVDARIVVVSGMGPAMIGAGVARRRGVQHVVVGHGKEFAARGSWRHRWFRRVCRSADLLIAVSDFTLARARAAHMAPARAMVIHNGADAVRYRPVEPPADWRERHGLGNGPVIVTVGRVCERKGQDLVVRALARAVAEAGGALDDAVYACVGLPAGADRVRDVARECGIESRVRIVGPAPADELPAWYSCADLFALTSRTSADGDVEGYGIVVIEAALCGTAAVVTDHGGLPETVVPGQTGWVVPENDPDTLARALVDVLAVPGRAAEAGRAADRRARSEGSWECRVADYDRALRALIGAGEAG